MRKVGLYSVLLYDAHADLIPWVSNHIFGVPDFFGEAKAIGVVKNNRLVGAVVYSGMQCSPAKIPFSIEMSVASIDKSWANRHNLHALFAYPFIQLRLKRVQIFTSTINEGMISVSKRLGFTMEGLHRGAWPAGGDSISWGMMKDECKWINF